MRFDLAAILGAWLPHILLTDSMSLFNLLIHLSAVSMQIRLMIYLITLREAFERENSTDVGWLGSDHNLADILTNPAERAQLA